jgi:uncharacterized membrane protein HdeD (DUF308 family)
LRCRQLFYRVAGSAPIGTRMETEIVKMPGWARGVAIVIGVIALALGITILVYPNVALWLVVIILGFGLIILGVDRLASGIVGQMARIKTQ